jgi:barstar (barnase inhibitor)
VAGRNRYPDDMPADLPVLVIDGARFDDLPGFAREFSSLLDDYTWTDNLDAFNDILRGGFGTPEGGFVLRWLDSDRSRQRLGWDATTEWLARNLERCHPSNRESVQERLAQAREHQGTTVFEWIVGIIGDHGPGGREADDNVHLELL